MKRRRFLTTTVGVMVPSVGLVLLSGERVAQAAPPDKIKPNQSWDENLPSASRFTVLSAFGGAAVRDNNTGLVWEQAPDNSLRVRGIATSYCVNKLVGGTLGWRLPSVVELMSLQEIVGGLYVKNTVFTGVRSGGFWSATSGVNENNQSGPWWMDPQGGMFIGAPSYTLRAWCVRGPMNADAY